MSVTWDAETLWFYSVLCLFRATVPSECHMKNSFFLNNYPVKHEAQCSEANGELAVNILTIVLIPFLFV